MAVKCNICLKQFTKRCNLLRHVSNVHSDEIQKFICYHCNENFTRKSSLIRHASRKHGNSNGNNNSSTAPIKCVMCSFRCEKKNMLDHYRLLHDIDITTCSESFSDFMEFEKWKAIMEKETTSKYVKYRTKTTNNKMIHFYRCHRDGFYKSSGKNIRHLKQLGSNKINGYCPAKLDVTVNGNGNVKVKFIKSHVGHEMDLERLTLSKTEKDDIASKLSQKIPFDEVLNCVRDGITSDNDLGRIHLLTKKDLFNIKNTYNLHNNAVRHSNDCPSVEAWIEEMREKHNDSIVEVYILGQDDPNYPDLQLHCSQNMELPHEIDDVKATLQRQFTEILSKVTNMEGAEAVQKALLPLKPILSTLENKNLHSLPEIADKLKKCAKSPKELLGL